MIELFKIKYDLATRIMDAIGELFAIALEICKSFRRTERELSFMV